MSDAEYVSDVHRVRVELHWRLTDLKLLSVDFSALYNRSKTTVIAGYPARLLGPEDQLLYLMAHGSGHAWCRLGWLCDITRILHRHETIDWSQVVTRTSDIGLGRVVDQALYLAHVLLGAPLPARPTRRSEPGGQTAYLVTSAIRGMLEPKAFLVDHILWGTRYKLKLRRSICYKAGILRKILLRPQHWDVVPLPRPLFPLHYALNPLLMVVRYLSRTRRCGRSRTNRYSSACHSDASVNDVSG